MDEMWRPVVKTSVTTAVGFLSFALSPIGAVRAFGIFTAVGIVFCMAWSLAVTPAMLALARPGWMIGRRGRRLTASPAVAVTGGGRLFGGVSRLAVRGRYVVIGWPRGEDGRKVYAGSAVFDEDGALNAYAVSTWIKLLEDPSAQT